MRGAGCVRVCERGVRCVRGLCEKCERGVRGV